MHASRSVATRVYFGLAWNSLILAVLIVSADCAVLGATRYTTDTDGQDNAETGGEVEQRTRDVMSVIDGDMPLRTTKYRNK